MIELGSLAALIGATIAITGAIGGLLLRAFIVPVKTRTDDNHATLQDHERRMRSLETKVNTHSIHMENILKAVDQLVVKIDLLVSARYNRTREDK